MTYRVEVAAEIDADGTVLRWVTSTKRPAGRVMTPGAAVGLSRAAADALAARVGAELSCGGVRVVAE